MFCLHILLKKAALSLDEGLHTASEGHAGLGHHDRVHGGKVLLNGGDQWGLGSVGTSVSMCPQVAPHKIVQRIKIRTATYVLSAINFMAGKILPYLGV
jgi:hypothetical protein